MKAIAVLAEHRHQNRFRARLTPRRGPSGYTQAVHDGQGLGGGCNLVTCFNELDLSFTQCHIFSHERARNQLAECVDIVAVFFRQCYRESNRCSKRSRGRFRGTRHSRLDYTMSRVCSHETGDSTKYVAFVDLREGKSWVHRAPQSTPTLKTGTYP